MMWRWLGVNVIQYSWITSSTYALNHASDFKLSFLFSLSSSRYFFVFFSSEIPVTLYLSLFLSSASHFPCVCILINGLRGRDLKSKNEKIASPLFRLLFLNLTPLLIWNASNFSTILRPSSSEGPLSVCNHPSWTHSYMRLKSRTV